MLGRGGSYTSPVCDTHVWIDDVFLIDTQASWQADNGKGGAECDKIQMHNDATKRVDVE